MRIGFDATTAAFPRKTGTGVYTEELIKGFEREFPQDEITHSYRLTRYLRGREHLLPLGKNSRQMILQDPWTGFQGRKFDVFHGLNARLPHLKGCLRVVTIHDLFSLYGHFSKEKFRKDQEDKIRKTLDRADHIIVPATFTKEQLVGKLGFSDSKVTVVTEGVKEDYLVDFEREREKIKLREKFRIHKDFFLFVGTFEKRKNIETCLKAFRRFQSQSGQTHQLVLVGQPGFGFENIKPLISSDVVVLDFLEGKWLASLYQAADAFLFLSWEEGFGIPVIEAMASGCPVISSNTTSLPEVGAGFTFLVSPDDVEGAVQAMKLCVSPNDILKSQWARAQKHARTLTWGHAARLTRQVYERM